MVLLFLSAKGRRQRTQHVRPVMGLFKHSLKWLRGSCVMLLSERLLLQPYPHFNSGIIKRCACCKLHGLKISVPHELAFLAVIYTACMSAEISSLRQTLCLNNAFILCSTPWHSVLCHKVNYYWIHCCLGHPESAGHVCFVGQIMQLLNVLRTGNMAKLDRCQSVVNQWVSAGNTTRWMCAKQCTHGASRAYVSECLVIVLSLASHSSVQLHGPWKLADMHTGVSMDGLEIARILPLLASVLKDDEMELWALLTQ